MIWDVLQLAALGLIVAGLAGWGGRQLWRLGTMRRSNAKADEPAVSLPPFRPVTPGAFVSSNDQGAFGEALTFAMMAAQGWRPVNGKPGTGPQGIDGIFVRQGEDGLEACLIETKTNASAYAPRQMANAKLCEDLTRLYVTCGDPARGALYAWLYKGLTQDDPRIAKALWRHHLARGVTETVALNPAGDKDGPVTLLPSHGYMEAIAASLDELDRGRRYWSGLYPS